MARVTRGRGTTKMLKWPRKPMIKITFSLLPAIFIISSIQPANAERAAFVAEEKDASSELMLHHLLHLGSWMVWAAVYVFLMEGSPTFEDTMGKIELSSPVAIVSNILIRLLYNMIQSWSVISGSLQRSCCGCSTLYPFSTKTREVSGNPSLTSERFLETLGFWGSTDSLSSSSILPKGVNQEIPPCSSQSK